MPNYGGLTLLELQAGYKALQQALISGALSATYNDGNGSREVRFRSAADITVALSAVQEMINVSGGQVEQRVGLAQHRRGDGPAGPGSPGYGWW